jgi:hypothetical protein
LALAQRLVVTIECRYLEELGASSYKKYMIARDRLRAANDTVAR